MLDLLKSLFDRERPPNIDLLVTEARRQRVRAARIVEALDEKHESSERRLEQAPSWEELLIGHDGEQR